MRKRSCISPDMLCVHTRFFPWTAFRLFPLLSFLPSCSIFALRVRCKSKQPILAPYLSCGWTGSRWGRGSRKHPCFLRSFGVGGVSRKSSRSNGTRAGVVCGDAAHPRSCRREERTDADAYGSHVTSQEPAFPESPPTSGFSSQPWGWRGGGEKKNPTF